MLFLQFQLGQDRYVLDSSQVVEVLPLLGIKQIPQAPAGVVGAFNYRGKPVPVIDLSELTLGCPARRHMSTRIIIVLHPGGNGGLHLLGLIAERATETMQRDPADFADSGVVNDDAPYLGPVATDPNGLVQRIEVARLLPAAIRDVLFKQPLEWQ
ncbi:MAG: chemotaxis protein CheW [Burkholderiales bacterium]